MAAVVFLFPGEPWTSPARAAADWPTAATTPAAPSPPRPSFDIQIMIRRERDEPLASLFGRAGLDPASARRAAALLTDPIAEDAEFTLALGRPDKSGDRRLIALQVRARMNLALALERDRDDRLRLIRRVIQVDATPRRFRGRVGDNLFWSLRAEGVTAEAAAEFVAALSQRADGARLSPNDRFDVVVDHRLAATGEIEVGPLLYAALDRADGRDVGLVRWTFGSESRLVDPRAEARVVKGIDQPVAGPVTSGYGVRVHPILRFARWHRGVDYGATWGSPIQAAADGVVSSSGWNGGYGRQVRVVHAGGYVSTYSHMAGLAARPGDRIRQGDVIGTVGSSGLSTGPHLHFEVFHFGRHVDPTSLPRQRRIPILPEDRAAMAARLAQLRTI